MAKTFDTSRVGGGTYELEQDASGNYKLKSVGFQQVNKLNLPDLATSDTPVKKRLPVEEEKKTEVADPFKKLSAQNTGGGEGGGGQDYSGVMLKTPEVKDVSVRDAGDAMTKEQLTESFAGEEKPTQTYAEQLANIQRGQMTDINIGFGEQKLDTERFKGSTTGTLSDPLEKQDVKPERTTGLQKVTSKAKALGTDAISKTKKIIGTVAKMLIPGATLLSNIMPERTATQQVNVDHFNVRNDGRIAGNPATDLYAGMNRTSDFGNLERAGNKRISTREKTAARKGYTKDNDPTGVVAKTEKMKNDARSYKQAKETATDTSPGATGGEGGGGGGSDSGRVICTDLHRTGELSTRDWVRDTKFTFKTLSKTHVKGYLLWAEPTVKHIQKYPRYRKIWKHIAQHRANDIAWRLNEGKFDLLGRIYAGIGEPVCWALGNFVSNKQISKYNLTHWRRA